MHEQIKKLVQYHIWANKKLLSHVNSLPENIFSLEVQSVFPSICKTFEHLFSVDALWLNRLKGTMPKQINAYLINDLEQAQQIFTQLSEDYLSFVNEENNVMRNITYQNTKGETFEEAVYDLLQHIVNHGTYHRGNIAAMIRQLGHPGVSTDYIAYIREIKHVS